MCMPSIPAKAASFFFWNASVAEVKPKSTHVNQQGIHTSSTVLTIGWTFSRFVFVTTSPTQKFVELVLRNGIYCFHTACAISFTCCPKDSALQTNATSLSNEIRVSVPCKSHSFKLSSFNPHRNLSNHFCLNCTWPSFLLIVTVINLNLCIYGLLCHLLNCFKDQNLWHSYRVCF